MSSFCYKKNLLVLCFRVLTHDLAYFCNETKVNCLLEWMVQRLPIWTDKKSQKWDKVIWKGHHLIICWKNIIFRYTIILRFTIILRYTIILKNIIILCLLFHQSETGLSNTNILINKIVYMHYILVFSISGTCGSKRR